jgi:4-hydroxy-4-methyl-2-oxoglutarate aldolase
MTSKVYRQIPLCDPALVEEAGRYSVAELHESMEIIPGRMALFGGDIRPLNPGIRVAGQAVTAFVFPGDGLLGHKAVQLIKPGQILVVANGGSGPQTMFAELVALAARKAGARGAIVESCVRDVEALREMRFPVWSSGVHCGHTGKAGPGSVNIPIVCAGVRVDPGVADDDGAICLPPALALATFARARLRAEREVKIRAAIDEGKVLFDILKLQEALAASGVEEIEGTWNG